MILNQTLIVALVDGISEMGYSESATLSDLREVAEEELQNMECNESREDNSEFNYHVSLVSRTACILGAQDEVVVLSKEKYDKMQSRLDWLSCLESAGVDNWEGYDVAQDLRDASNED